MNLADAEARIKTLERDNTHQFNRVIELENEVSRLKVERDNVGLNAEIHMKRLRDEFAMSALSGILANPETSKAIIRGASFEGFIENAFTIADTCMELRK